MNYVKSNRIWLKSSPTHSEKWVQDKISKDPAILGLGDLVLRDQERSQPGAGRLDLLLQDPDTKRRYEVELQLGSSDETHIIRTIEYWDIERKRYPQYDHCAVLVAEDITSRFLNVVSLFNGSIPLIAIQMQLIQVEEYTTLPFTTVIDELTRGLVEEDEDSKAAPADRAYWNDKSTSEMTAIADQLLSFVRASDESLTMNYTKFYIGLLKDGAPFNIFNFKLAKKHAILEIKLPETEQTNNYIEASGFDTLDYYKRYGIYRLRITPKDVETKEAQLRELLSRAYQHRAA